MKPLIHAMSTLVAQGEAFALATVITRNGSAPRSAGAKMLVRADGSSLGTVGGGILEAQVQQLAAEVLRTRAAVVREFRFSGTDAATMDAICGGRVEVLVEWIDATDPEIIALAAALQAAVEQHRKAWLVTTLAGTFPHHALVHPDGSLTGSLPAGVAPADLLEICQPGQITAGAQSLMVEPLDIAGTVYIFGAGHVSRSLAEFTRAVGFWTVVLDDRGDYANPARFPGADEIIVLDSFEGCFARLEIERDSFIVIVTRGHLNDRLVLAQALKTEAGYIGMIGSRRKTALVSEELSRSGFTPADLARVHAPIGLSIGAETPEEIGISIVAELIQVRAAQSLITR